MYVLYMDEFYSYVLYRYKFYRYIAYRFKLYRYYFRGIYSTGLYCTYIYFVGIYCKGGNENQSMDHILFHCDNTREQRDTMIRHRSMAKKQTEPDQQVPEDL